MLAATALSPEKRARQTKRADYWIRTRNLLRARFKQLLQRPHREPSLTRVTQSMERDSVAEPDTTDFQQSGPRGARAGVADRAGHARLVAG